MKVIYSIFSYYSPLNKYSVGVSKCCFNGWHICQCWYDLSTIISASGQPQLGITYVNKTFFLLNDHPKRDFYSKNPVFILSRSQIWAQIHLTEVSYFSSPHSLTDGILPSALQRDHRGWKEQEGQWWKLGLDGKEPLRLAARGGPRGANEIRDWVGKDPIAQGLAAQLPHWHQSIRSSICGREESIFSIFFGDLIFFFVGGAPGKQAREVTAGLARGHLLWNSANLKRR